MERENFVPEELTQDAQTTYSRSGGNIMPDGGGSSPETGPASPSGDLSKEEQIQRVQDTLSSNPAMDVVAKGVLERHLASLLTGSVPGGTVESAPGERSTKPKMTKGGVIDLDSLGSLNPPDPDTFPDGDLKKVAQILKALDKRVVNDPDLLEELDARVRALLGTNPVKADILIKQIKESRDFIKEYKSISKNESRRTFQLSLTGEDFIRLEDDPMEWLRSQLNRIYEYSSEGQELDSSQVRAAQQLQEVGSRYLTSIHSPKEIVRQFDDEFLTKLNIMYARATIQQRNMEGIAGMAKKLQAHGFLNSLSFEEGMVNRMHNRIQELYDDTRLRLPEHHITPEEHSKIQSRVIDEYIDVIQADPELIDRVLGKRYARGEVPMGKVKTGDQLRSAITRSVRTGYDHFVASQREAVIVARGDALPTDKDLQGILADPSGLFLMFNYEQMLVEKFGLLNHEQQQFFSAIKRKFAESDLDNKKLDIDKWVTEMVEHNPQLAHKHDGTIITDPKEIREAALVRYGQDLMKDLMLVNDFYSSSWRIREGFLPQLDDIFKYNFAKEKLRTTNAASYSRLDKIINWKPEYEAEPLSVAKPTSEDVAKAGKEFSELIGGVMRGMSEDEVQKAKDKAGDFALFMRIRRLGALGAKDSQPVWEKIAKYRPEDVVRIFREKGSPEEIEKVNEAFADIGITVGPDRAAQGFTPYDAFKEKYGSSLRLVREKGFDDFEQIDFSELTTNPKYAKYKELFNRAMHSDDGSEAVKIEGLFKKLKEFAGNTKEKGTIEKLMTDVRFGDIYSRAYSVDDVLLDKLEKVDEAAGLTQLSRRISPESGGDAYARTFSDATNGADAHTNFLKFLMAESQEEKLKSAVGAVEAAKHYGTPDLGAKVFRYTYGSYLLLGEITDESKLGTFYEVFDIQKLPFRKPINELQRIFGPQAPAFNNDKMLEYLDEHRGQLVGRHGEEMWLEMRKLARVRGGDRLTFMKYRAIIFGIAYLIFESVYSGGKTVGEGLESEELK